MSRFEMLPVHVGLDCLGAQMFWGLYSLFADLFSLFLSIKTCSCFTTWVFKACPSALWRVECREAKFHTATWDCCPHCDALIPKRHVLPPVVTACPPHPKAPQPCLVVQPLDVHGLLPTELPVGAETLHNLCLGLLGCLVPHLLQLLGELLLVSLLWLPVAELCSWSKHRWHLKPSTWSQAHTPPHATGFVFRFSFSFKRTVLWKGRIIRHVTGIQATCLYD